MGSSEDRTTLERCKQGVSSLAFIPRHGSDMGCRLPRRPGDSAQLRQPPDGVPGRPLQNIPLWHINFSFFFFRDAGAAYGSSQARGQMGATAPCLHHSHSNVGSKLCLRPTPQLAATNPGIKPRGQGLNRILGDTRQVCFH